MSQRRAWEANSSKNDEIRGEVQVPLVYRVAARVLRERQYHAFVKWMCFYRFRWKCRVRLHHTYVWNEVDGDRCSRCGQVDGQVALWLFWMPPGIWRLSFRIKHGRWA